ncbi:MAG: LysR family transcriptional regulator [Acidovorax sp.]
MEERLDSRRLRYFLQVLESGSLRSAAEALDMDPSAVSRAIALLEQQCGARLLERRGRGVAPTEAGDLLAAYLRRQHSQQQQLLAQLDGLHKLEHGHIDVVAGEGFVDWLMLHSLRAFMAEYPGITVDLQVGSTIDIVQRIVDDHAHIGLVFRPPADERLRSHHAHPQPIQTLVLDTHPLIRLRRPLLLSDLVPYPGALVHRGYGVRQHIDAAEISEGVRLQPRLRTSSFNAAVQFAMAGLGYTLYTRMALPPHYDDMPLAALPMQNPLLSAGEVHVVSRHGRLLSDAASALLRQIVSDMRAVSDSLGCAIN